MKYRRIAAVLAACLVAIPASRAARAAQKPVPPNVVYVFADQWRADALGHAGDPNVKTPNLDRLARQAVRFTHAVSGCPVCCPYRATLMTGRRPLTHGVFLNDVQLPDDEVAIAELFAAQGYKTAYIGKWHLDGHGRSAYIPPERRQGFQYFKALECTHNYNRKDPYQLNNLIGEPQYAEVQAELDALLRRKLRETGDAFLPGEKYVEKWRYPVDRNGTVPYTP